MVAVDGAGGLLTCAIIAISGVMAARRATPPGPGEAVASDEADVGEIKERAHR